MFYEIATLEEGLHTAKMTHYVKNDLHVPWQKVLHKRNRPLLKGFLRSPKRQLDNFL